MTREEAAQKMLEVFHVAQDAVMDDLRPFIHEQHAGMGRIVVVAIVAVLENLARELRACAMRDLSIEADVFDGCTEYCADHALQFGIELRGEKTELH